MTNAMTPQVVRSYLAQLDAALDGVPDDVRRDILSGVAEELAGLDAPAAAARIEALGDPKFIAAEARSSAGPSEGASAPRGNATSAPWYAAMTVLLLILGGFLFPVVGWVAGVVLLWASPMWSNREKWAGLLYGPIAGIAGGSLYGVIVGMIPGLFTGWGILVPAIILASFGNLVVGIRLLRSAQNRR